MRAAVAAGEQSGQLGPALLRLADYTERRAEFTQALIAALAYPVLLTGVALLIVTGLLVYVVPQVVHVFEHLGHQLPILTRALITLAAFVQGYGAPLLLVLIALALAARAALLRPALRARWHGVLLRLPLLGRTLRAADTARVTKTLAMLSGSGVPLLDALRLAARTARMAPLREALMQAALRVREGQGFARALADSGQFPPVALRLIASGEKSGRLDLMLEAAAQHESREVETRLRTIGSVIGPLVILMVGGMVLLIVLAILLPIFQLNSLIR
jgi:general secretion pathway protein F